MRKVGDNTLSDALLELLSDLDDLSKDLKEPDVNVADPTSRLNEVFEKFHKSVGLERI